MENMYRLFGKILQNTPKTGFWLKTDLRIVTGVFFYPPWTKFGGKSSTEHLIQAKSVILLEFLHIFGGPFFSGMAIPYTKAIQQTSWYHPSL